MNSVGLYFATLSPPNKKDLPKASLNNFKPRGAFCNRDSIPIVTCYHTNSSISSVNGEIYCTNISVIICVLYIFGTSHTAPFPRLCFVNWSGIICRFRIPIQILPMQCIHLQKGHRRQCSPLRIQCCRFLQMSFRFPLHLLLQILLHFY